MGKQPPTKQKRYELGEPLTSRPNKRSLKSRKFDSRKPVDHDAPISLADVVLEKGKTKEEFHRISSSVAKRRSHAPSVHTSPSPPKTFRIIAGSYEKLLYGIEVSFSSPKPFSASDEKVEPGSIPNPSSSSSSLVFKPIFIFPAHIGCVKAVAASPSGRWLSTGSSADEIVKVWDLRRLKEVGGLMQHEGNHKPCKSSTIGR
jgi:protein MAK11